jgi:hypothetical protein
MYKRRFGPNDLRSRQVLVLLTESLEGISPNDFKLWHVLVQMTESLESFSTNEFGLKTGFGTTCNKF